MNRKQTALSIAAAGAGICVLYSLLIASKRRRMDLQRRETLDARAQWENEGGAPTPSRAV